jgi:hypothetical protein
VDALSEGEGGALAVVVVAGVLGDGDGLVDGLGDGDGLGEGDRLGDGEGEPDGDGLGEEGDGLGDVGVGTGGGGGGGGGAGAGGIAGTTRVAPKNADHQIGAIFTCWPAVGASTILLSPR